MHNKLADAEDDNATRMGRGEGEGKRAAADALGQKGVRAAKGDSGAELRGCETASWTPLRTVPWSDEGADAVPACGDSAESEENGAAGAILLAVTCSERAGRKVEYAGKPAETYHRVVTEKYRDRDLRSLQKKTPTQKYGVRQQSEDAK